VEMKIEMIPCDNIACIRQVGPYGADNMQTMERLKAWAAANHLLNDESVILGIAQDNPATTAPENCRYDACLVIFDDATRDDHIRYGTAAGGKYAVFTIDHTVEAVRNAWGKIFPELQRHGACIDVTRPVIERYAARMVRNHKCEICVPVY
jgi:DNA gyrase inhibitor GyrI